MSIDKEVEVVRQALEDPDSVDWYDVDVRLSLDAALATIQKKYAELETERSQFALAIQRKDARIAELEGENERLADGLHEWKLSDQRQQERIAELEADVEHLQDALAIANASDVLRLRRIEEAAREAVVALRVALHYTEAEYDDEGAEALIGCRVAEQNLRTALQENDKNKRA